MQINENEARDDQTREILDYYRGLPERSSQEAIVEMLRELQDIHGCISPYMLEQAAEAAGVRDSMVQAICKRYPSLKRPITMRSSSAPEGTVRQREALLSWMN